MYWIWAQTASKAFHLLSASLNTDEKREFIYEEHTFQWNFAQLQDVQLPPQSNFETLSSPLRDSVPIHTPAASFLYQCVCSGLSHKWNPTRCALLYLACTQHQTSSKLQYASNHVSFASINGYLGWSLFLQGLISIYHCLLSFEYSCPHGCDVSHCFWAAFLLGCWTYFHTLILPSLYYLWRNIDERPLTSFRVDYLFIFTFQEFFKYSVQLSLLRALTCVFFDSLHGFSAFFEDIVAQTTLTKLETKLCISLLLFMVLVFYFK